MMNIIFRKLIFLVFALQVIRNEALLLLTHLTREAEVRSPAYICNCFFLVHRVELHVKSDRSHLMINYL